MKRTNVIWLSRRAVVVAGILFVGFSLAAFVQGFPLPVFLYAFPKALIAETVRYTGIVTTFLYAIKEGTN